MQEPGGLHRTFYWVARLYPARRGAVLSKEGDLEPGVVGDEVLLAQPTRVDHVVQRGAAEDERLICTAVQLQRHDPGTAGI